MRQISGRLAEDLLWLRSQFGGSVDFYVKEARLCGVDCAVCACDDLAGMENLWQQLLRPLQEERRRFLDGERLFDALAGRSGLVFSGAPLTGLAQVFASLCAGNAVLLAQGAPRALVLSAQSYAYRSPGEPENERSVYGSREAFCDVLRKNLGLIRRRVRTPGLVIETFHSGVRTGTEVALIYHRAAADPALVAGVRRRLRGAKLQMVFDSAYFIPFLERHPASLFSCVGVTERADTLCAKVCEGRVAVLADGTPHALLVPFFFTEHFACMDDYSSRPYYASLLRLLKFAAFLTAMLLPGVFVAAAACTPQLLPQQLLYKIAAGEAATPLPLFAETVLVNLLLEVIKEAGLRLPKTIGHSVGLVAALIIGDAAVRFELLSSPVMVVAALSVLCGFAVPTLYQPLTVLRLLFILAGGLLGPLGIALLALFTLYNMTSLNSYGVPYTAPLTPYGAGLWRDGLLRLGGGGGDKRPFCVADLPGAGRGKRHGR